GIKGDAGLEFGGELPSRFGHKKPPLTSYVHLSSRSSFPNPLLTFAPYLPSAAVTTTTLPARSSFFAVSEIGVIFM
ncbi:hypothetical protein, partial [Desulfovibrio sp.]|uniref:hypothetical protein n=1 Tax=Desulfovibrio sp. TaxID=885 RepID=UPI003D110ABD